MDKFSRYYAWFLLVATALPAIVRLASPRQLALVTSERIANEKRRTRYRWLAWISIVGSVALIPVYLFYSHRRWLIVAFIIGVLTGVEMLGNTARPEEQSLTRQNRIFGVAYAIAAVFTYFFAIRNA